MSGGFPNPGVLLRWAVAIGWAAMVFTFSTGEFVPGTTRAVLGEILQFFHVQFSPAGFEILHMAIRKLAHLTEYAILALLLYRVSSNRLLNCWDARRAVIAITIAAVFSLTDEFHQIFVPGRHASLADCGVDTIGATLAMLVPYAKGQPAQGISSAN